MFTIEDEIHADGRGEFSNLDSAMAELHRLARTPWDEPPNRAPCMSWAACGRDWELIEWDRPDSGRRPIRRPMTLHVSAGGKSWTPGVELVPTDMINPPTLRDGHKRATRRTGVDHPDRE